MKKIIRLIILVSSMSFAGCYTGARFNLVAPNLDHPVSMTQSIHGNKLNILPPGGYEEISRFTLTFTGWSLGFPLSPNPQKDISDRLNAVVQQNGGDGIVGLTITVGNNSFNGVTMALKGVSVVAFLSSLLILKYDDQSVGLVLAGASLAGILFLPTAADFTITGTVVKFRNGKAGP